MYNSSTVLACLGTALGLCWLLLMEDLTIKIGALTRYNFCSAIFFFILLCKNFNCLRRFNL